MKKFSKNIYKIPFLLLIILALYGVEFFHNHSTIHNENNCQVCVFNRILSSSDITAETAFENFLNFEFVLPALELQNPESGFKSAFSSRAPPFSS